MNAKAQAKDFTGKYKVGDEIVFTDDRMPPTEVEGTVTEIVEYYGTYRVTHGREYCYLRESNMRAKA